MTVENAADYKINKTFTMLWFIIKPCDDPAASKTST